MAQAGLRRRPRSDGHPILCQYVLLLHSILSLYVSLVSLFLLFLLFLLFVRGEETGVEVDLLTPLHRHYRDIHCGQQMVHDWHSFCKRVNLLLLSSYIFLFIIPISTASIYLFIYILSFDFF